MTEPTLAALLDVARDLVAQRQFDIEVVQKLLSEMPSGDLALQARGAIRHAQLVVAAAGDGSISRVAVARFALARVVVLLEQELGLSSG